MYLCIYVCMYVFILLATGPCGILVPQPGIEPSAPALGAQSPNHWTAREVLLSNFKANVL